MKVLIGCEESGIVRDAFRARGHDAWSCDLVESRRCNNYHYQGDIMDLLDHRYLPNWDLIILHPPCTALALSGNRWYGRGMPKAEERYKAIQWTSKLWLRAIGKAPRVALENPASVIFQYLSKDLLQWVQPWMFGHGEVKKTGLALFNLPELEPTNEVEGREERVWRMAPGPNRARDRSETYQGIADAMAEQWGKL